MDDKFIKWFINEIPVLHEKGIVSEQTAKSLNDYYVKKLEDIVSQAANPAFTELTTVSEPLEKVSSAKAPAVKKSSKLSISVILTVVASVLISFGIISLIAYNWAAIPRLAKAITAILLLAGTQAGGLFLLKTGRAASPKIRESYSIFWALLFGGIVAFVSQIFKFTGDSTSFLLAWTISSILITFLFNAHTSFYFSLVLFILFIADSFNTNLALFIYPIFIALYCLIRKSQEKAKLIPLFILGAFVFLFRIGNLKLSENLLSLIFYFALFSIGFVCLRKKLPACKYTGLGILCVTALLGLFTEATDLLFRSAESKFPPSQIPELIIISVIILGLYLEGAVLPFCKKIKNKEGLGFTELLYLLPVILSLSLMFVPQTTYVFYAKLTEAGTLFISPYLIIVLFTTALYLLSAIKKDLCQWIFLGFLILESLNILHNKYFAPTLAYTFIVILLFTSGVFLLQEQFKLTKKSFWFLTILRAITALFYFITATLALNSNSALYQTSGIPLAMFGCYIPAAVFTLFLLALFAKQNSKSFLENLDIPLNLIFIAVIFAIANKCDSQKLSIVMEAGFIINLSAALVFIIYKKRFDYSSFILLGFFYYFQSILVNENYDSASGSSIFLLFALITIFVHLAGQLKKNDSMNKIAAIVSGFILFYETSLLNIFEKDSQNIFISFYQVAGIIVLSLAAVYLLYILIKRKQIFNPAIILLPAAIIVLTFIPDKFSILITFPLLFIFCLYYFYLAFKNDSLFVANVVTVYFGIMLMIRFFSAGYGLAAQGITLISMGILLLVMNILMTKRKESHE